MSYYSDKPDYRKIKQTGYCNTCGIATGDIWYVFCGKECSDIWVFLKEKDMGHFDVPEDLYKQWLMDKTQAIEDMKTKEEVEARIVEIWRIKFFANKEWAMLFNRADAIMGKNAMGKWVKEERDKYITEPDIKIERNGEPRKKEPKEKKAKYDLIGSLTDIDINKELEEIRARKKKPQTDDEAIAELAAALSAPPVVKVQATDEEKKAKTDALKEKMRLAKEKNTNV